jgi:hypothetical protein
MVLCLISRRDEGAEVGSGWEDESINEILLQILDLLLFAEESSRGFGLPDADDVRLAE